MKSVVRKRREVNRLRLCSDSADRTVCLIASSTKTIVLCHTEQPTQGLSESVSFSVLNLEGWGIKVLGEVENSILQLKSKIICVYPRELPQLGVHVTITVKPLVTLSLQSAMALFSLIPSLHVHPLLEKSEGERKEGLTKTVFELH